MITRKLRPRQIPEGIFSNFNNLLCNHFSPRNLLLLWSRIMGPECKNRSIRAKATKWANGIWWRHLNIFHIFSFSFAVPFTKAWQTPGSGQQSIVLFRLRFKFPEFLSRMGITAFSSFMVRSLFSLPKSVNCTLCLSKSARMGSLCDVCIKDHHQCNERDQETHPQTSVEGPDIDFVFERPNQAHHIHIHTQVCLDTVHPGYFAQFAKSSTRHSEPKFASWSQTPGEFKIRMASQQVSDMAHTQLRVK